MKTLRKNARNGNHDEASEFACYQCPTCHMFAWRDPHANEKITCPFCSHVMPDYLTRISPEIMRACGEASQKTFAEPLAKDSSDASPFIIEFFMVQGTGFRCMAYRHRDGKWHGAFDNEELPGAVRVLE